MMFFFKYRLRRKVKKPTSCPNFYGNSAVYFPSVSGLISGGYWPSAGFFEKHSFFGDPLFLGLRLRMYV